MYQEIIQPYFDQTMLLYFESVPMIQSWAIAIGTNRPDSLLSLSNNNSKKNNTAPITTVWDDFHASLQTDNDEQFFQFVHSYNRTKKNTKDSSTKAEAAVEENNSLPPAGILLILEAENATLFEEYLSLQQQRQDDDNDNTNKGWLSFFLRDTLVEALLKKGDVSPLAILPSSSSSSDIGENEILSGVITLEEGYIIVRYWPSSQNNNHYCAFDVQLWDKFHTLDSIQSTLLQAVKSQQPSSYRILTSTANTMNNNDNDIGPPTKIPIISFSQDNKQQKKDESNDETSININKDNAEDNNDDKNGKTNIDSSMMSKETEETAAATTGSIIWKECLGMIPTHDNRKNSEEEDIVVILCGNPNEFCVGRETILSLSSPSFSFETLWTCPNLITSSNDDINKMFSCEINIWEKLQEITTTTKHGKIKAFLLDESASNNMSKFVLHFFF